MKKAQMIFNQPLKVISIYLLFQVSICFTQLYGQNNYDIRFVLSTATSTEVCYDVQIRSTNTESWILAGQNYRLYYDASALSFNEGISLLNDNYQDFRLVQHQAHVDASTSGGNLSFDSDLGFLNYTIDLLNTIEGGTEVPTGDSWLSTNQLCFTIENDNAEDACLVWARFSETNAYATSFVNISSWIGTNSTVGAIGNNYFDIGAGCRKNEIEDIPQETIGEGSGRSNTKQYNIRLQPIERAENSTTQCYDVQLQSGSDDSWSLAGQNYRLYYDASKVSFDTGTSLLGSVYQDFTLIDDLQDIDATSIDSDLPFAANLGFLNYAIDMLNVSESGATVPANNWLSTSRICFEVSESAQDLDNPLCAVWARMGYTDKYATSFTEISSWEGISKTQSSISNNYEDLLGTSCENSNPPKIRLQAKVYLQGAFDEDSGLMRDRLRELGLVPMVSPYIIQENYEARPESEVVLARLSDISILEIEGEEAIVDWVEIALRDKNDSGLILERRAALILRSGQIVDVDGESPVAFDLEADEYFISIHHRNHLSIMSYEPINFIIDSETTIDFTSASTKVYGTNARCLVGDALALWGGNADGDAYLVFQGAGVALPDGDRIFYDVFTDETNVGSHYNHITKGYYRSDTNMDGEVRYQGGDNDIDDLIFFNIFSFPDNTNFFSNYFIREQIPPTTN